MSQLQDMLSEALLHVATHDCSDPDCDSTDVKLKATNQWLFIVDQAIQQDIEDAVDLGELAQTLSELRSLFYYPWGNSV